jgi:hypothetical protein
MTKIDCKKKKKNSYHKNYTFSKLYSAFFNERLVTGTYLENNNSLADEQNGFRKGRSCIYFK